MRRTLLPIAAAALLAGCGSAGDDLLSERQAESLLTAVDDVERAVGAQDCGAARRAAQDGAEQAAELPRRVDRELRQNLGDWFEHLADRARRDCEQPEPEETPTIEPSPTETAEPTPTQTAEPTPTETAEPTVTAEPTPEDGTGGVEPPPDDGVDGEG